MLNPILSSSKYKNGEHKQSTCIKHISYIHVGFLHKPSEFACQIFPKRAFRSRGVQWWHQHQNLGWGMNIFQVGRNVQNASKECKIYHFCAEIVKLLAKLTHLKLFWGKSWGGGGPENIFWGKCPHAPLWHFIWRCSELQPIVYMWVSSK